MVASPLLALGGLVGGFISARLVPASPPETINAALWAIVGGVTGYLVFSSEGPQRRPASVRQAAVADGVVSGILTALTGILVDVVAASGAGSSVRGPLSTGGAVVALLVAVPAGALGGAALGAVALTLGGRTRFERMPLVRPKRTRPASPAAPRRSAERPARKRSKR